MPYNINWEKCAADEAGYYEVMQPHNNDGELNWDEEDLEELSDNNDEEE